MTAPERVSTVDRVRPWLLLRRVGGIDASDLALAGVVTVFAVLDVTLSPDWRGSQAVNLVVVASMALSLVWRRTRPLVPLGAVAAGALALGVAYGSSQTWTGIFLIAVAVYSAAAHSRQLVGVVALTIAVSVAHTGNDPEVRSFGEAIWTSSLAGLALLAGLTGRRLGRRAHDLDALAAQLERDEEERAAAAAAEERRRIAHELHDIISHSLGVLVLQAGAAEHALERHPDQVRDVLQSMRRTGTEAIGEMGTLLGLIRTEGVSSRAPRPSLRDLDDLVARTKGAGLPVSLEVSLGRRTIPAAVELSAYRVVQEALTNVLKHAPAAPTSVTVNQRNSHLEIEIVNEPTAASPTEAPGGRRGLAGLAERLAVFDGELDAGPVPGGGWAVRATFPIPS